MALCSRLVLHETAIWWKEIIFLLQECSWCSQDLCFTITFPKHYKVKGRDRFPRRDSHLWAPIAFSSRQDYPVGVVWTFFEGHNFCFRIAQTVLSCRYFENKTRFPYKVKNIPWALSHIRLQELDTTVLSIQSVYFSGAKHKHWVRTLNISLLSTFASFLGHGSESVCLNEEENEQIPQTSLHCQQIQGSASSFAHHVVKGEKFDSPVKILVVCHYFAFHFSYKCILMATSVSTDSCNKRYWETSLV